MAIDIAQYENAVRRRDQRRKFAEHAAVVCSPEAAATLRAEADAMTAALEKYPAAVAEYRSAHEAREEAERTVARKMAACDAGSLRRSELEDSRQDLQIAEQAERRAHAAVVTLLNRGVEAVGRETDELLRLARANIEAVAKSCASGFGQYWNNTTAYLGRPENAFEAIFEQAAIESYAPLDTIRAEPIETLRHCIGERARFRSSRVTTPAQTETIVKAMPLPKGSAGRMI